MALPILMASVMVATGIIFPVCWYLVLPGFFLFLHTIIARCGGVGRVLAGGLFFGVITGGAGIIWFWDTLPLDFLGIASVTAQRLGVGITWLYVAFALGVPVAIGAAMLWWLRASRWFPVWAGLIWVLVEVGRMWSFAIFTWSPSSLLGPHFSAASVGYALAENPLLLQLARPFGINMLNFAVAAIAALAACWLRFKSPEARRGLAIQGIAMAVFVVLAPWLSLEKETERGDELPRLRIAILAEQIEDVMNHDHHVVATQLMMQAAAAQPPVDVVLIPEEISLTSIFWSKEEADLFLREHFGDRDVLLLHTRSEDYPADEDPDAAVVNKSLFYESTSRGITGRYIKQMLMPLGEYAPAFARAFYAVIGDPDISAHLEVVQQFQLNVTPPATAAHRGVTLGSLLCSDLLSPWLYHHLAREGGADVLINLANQFWFHGSKTLHWKSLQMARVHAASHQRPFLVANNLSPSYALDARGRMIVTSRWGERTVLFVDVP
jgi:apolipoprotein N-acyltransferase